MKKLFLLLQAFTFAWLSAGCSGSDKLEIHAPAYMYNSDATISQKAEVALVGFFNHKNNNFEGSLTIDDIHLDKILFVPGTGLLSYEGEVRTYLGEIYFNRKTHALTIEISDSELYHALTKRNDKDGKVIISSPAEDLQQAVQVNTALKNE
ncbi:hypothetical protein [Paenibacillus harenae]|uniref:hypothetical protein n=1 Tax=Paenibacillus harenae TaxID=306543 RepID=UPI0004221E1F|nr:hypothetical protein [Paenibacillus harenae]